MRLVVLLMTCAAFAASPEQNVSAVLRQQVEAWNRGDLEAFVSAYSAETVFIGREVTRGDRNVLERYRRSYSTRAQMGTLAFSDLEVKPLGGGYASVIGRFHLQRTPEGGGDAQGIFTLLLRKTPAGWKIILDHTS